MLSINPRSIVQHEPIFVPCPIVTAPICGVKNVLLVSGVNENPNFPTTELGAIYTSSPNIENSI